MPALIAFFAWIAFIVAVIAGWVMNIVHIVKLPALVWTGELIARVVGIFLPPLGAFMGWFF